jgi:glycosyltransferase involved in cell wall biosynthesis
MRIVVQAEDAPPNIGGIATHVWELSRALVQLGHSVRLLTTRKDVPHPRNLTTWRARVRLSEGIEIHEVPVVYSPRRVFFEPQLALRFTNRLRSWIVNGEVDVLTFHFWDFDSLVVRPLAGLCPIVFTNHSSYFLQAVEDPGRRDLLWQRIGFADAIIAPSQELLEKTLLVGYPPERCRRIPNGVDTQRFLPREDIRARIRRELRLDSSALVCLCARRAVWKNGLLPLARALRDIHGPPGRRLVVLFAGLGSDSAPGGEKEYAALVRSELAQVPDGIECRLLGDVPHTKIIDLMQASDFSVIPSFLEATSLAGLEAMACQLPLVASDVGGLPELVDNGVEGLLFPPGDEASLGAALARMMSDDNFRCSAGEAARRKVLREFTWKHVGERTVEVYEQARRRSQNYVKEHSASQRYHQQITASPRGQR